MQNQTAAPSTRKGVAIALTAVLALLITALALFQGSLPRPIASGPDKVYHFIAFTALMLPVSALYPRALIWLVPWALIFGGAIELIQPFVNRSGEWADYWADLWGVAAGLLIGSATHYFMEMKALRTPG
ncbi:MAG: hypothetical protein ACSHXD_18030 [Marinosulfonomonas sp.]